MRICFLSLLFMVTGPQLWAQGISLSGAGQKYDVSYPYYLEDRNASLSFEEVIKADNNFKQARQKIPDFLGNFSKAVWYRIEVFNTSNTDNWFLEIKGGFMNRLTVYQVSEDNKVQSLTLNGDNHFDSRPIRSNNLIFPVTIPHGSGTKIYIRATSKTLIRTSMSLSTMQKLYEDTTRISYGDGFFTAVAVALLLYNLFVYFSLREKVYLYYIGYISASILHINLVSGHVQIFIPWLDLLNTTTILPIVSFFSILFTNTFLQTRKYVPFIYKIRWPLIVLCLIPLVFYLAGWYQMAILVASINIFLLFIYWLAAGTVALQKGFAPAIFYIIGFGALVLMSIVFDLKMRGLLEESYWTDSSLFIGASIEAIILSFALANKFNFYKKEKERLQEQAYQQAIHFSRELINMQEAERKRIASELHDSLGQKLVVIKNKILKASQSSATPTPPPAQELSQNVAEAIQEIRSISYGLRPYQLDLLGLTSSVKSLAEETFEAAQIDYKIQIDDIDRLFNNDARINIYRIVQECLNNIVKHAAAKNVQITIQHQEDTVKIIIHDDGSGFDSSQSHAGFGLKGIKERLLILGGTMTVTSDKNKGSQFEFFLPVKNENENEQ